MTPIHRSLHAALPLLTYLLLASGAWADPERKPTIAVLNIDSKGVIQDAEAMGYMVRLELEKTGAYSVLDRYEVADVFSKNKFAAENCFSKSCVVEAGKLLKTDKMLSGSVERFGEKIVVTMRLIDVDSGSIEKSDATEYLNLPEVQRMVEISVKKLLGIQPDQNMVNMLIDYDTPIASPKTSFRNSGPRMGASFTFGRAGERMQAGKNEGGFNMFPVVSQFGWQHELQYISAGKFQALVEFLLMVGGLESGKIVPSFSFLNGFRMGKWGLELGLGPTFRLVKEADGYFAGDSWHMESEWTGPGPNPNPIVTQLDDRGDYKLSTGLLIAAGVTLRSGYLNIPLNVYVSPRKEGTIVGASFGFNVQKKQKIE